MTVNDCRSEILEDYIGCHISAEPTYLRRLERATNLRLINGRMCSGHLQGRFLKMLVRMIKPKKVLELGTFSGYSSLCMAEGLEEGSMLITVEADDELEDFIKAALEDAGEVGRRVSLCIGDALEVMRTFPDESFDLVFMDADKRQYPEYYMESRRITRHGGFIVADNTLWDGHVAEQRRTDPQTDGIRLFNDLVTADTGVECVILPLRDGLTLIQRL